MTDIKRLGLGCMGMNFSNRERSINTIREALKGVARDRYFVSVKFGMLPKLGGGLYGIDVDPWHVRSYLLYSLKRLGLEYIVIADEKGISVSDLALLWTLAKYDHVSALISTTSVEHLSESIGALETELTTEDIKRIEAAFPAEKVKGVGMRAFTFRNGRFAG